MPRPPDTPIEAALERLAAAQARSAEQLGELAAGVSQLTARVDALAEAQRRTEERLEALTARVDALAEAQRRTEERLEALTARVDALAEAQRRTEERLEALTARVDALAEAQRRTEERLEALTARVDALAEAQRRTEERLEALTARVDALATRVDQLAEAQLRTERRLDRLAGQVARVTGVLGDIKGELLEMRYREKAAAYFQKLVLGVRSVSRDDLEELATQAERRGELSRSDHEDLLQVDVVVRGYLRHLQTDGYAVVEVSSQIDATDVERAARRAQLLHRLVQAPVVAAVAGATIGGEAAQDAVRLGVWQVVDGRVVAPDAAAGQHIG